MPLESRQQCLDVILASAANVQAKTRAARRRTAHSLRNLEIFKKVEIEGLTHVEAAAYFKLHRSRITQIVADVRRDLAQAATDDPEIKEFSARQRLEKEMEKMRLQHALDAAARAMRREQTILVTNRAGSRDKNGDKEGWSETVQRDIRPNMQPVNTYLRASRQLSSLSQREADKSPDTLLSDEDFFTAICVVIEDWQHRDFDGEDRPSEAFLAMVACFRNNAAAWVHRRLSGVSRHNAWPDAPPSETKNLESAAGQTSGQINLGASGINSGLTTGGEFSSSATTAAQAT